MPNVMAALPNIGGTLRIRGFTTMRYINLRFTYLLTYLLQRRKVSLTPTTRVPCSNDAKTRNPLKFTGVPETRQQISAASGPKFTILRGHVGRRCCLPRFFPTVDTCLSCEDIARQSCAMVPRWRFLAVFGFCISSEPRAAHFRPAF